MPSSNSGQPPINSGQISPGDDNGQQAEPGDDNGGHEMGDDQERACTSADLAQGTAVHEAELHGTVFGEIELVK